MRSASGTSIWKGRMASFVAAGAGRRANRLAAPAAANPVAALARNWRRPGLIGAEFAKSAVDVWAKVIIEHSPSKEKSSAKAITSAVVPSPDQLQPRQHDQQQAGKIDQPENQAKFPEVGLADIAAAKIHRRRPRGIGRDHAHQPQRIDAQ